MNNALVTPWSLLTTTAGLIAFHIGLFTLVGRERKSPYVINSVFPIFILCLISACLALSAALTPASFQKLALQISGWTLVLAFLFTLYAVYRIAARFVYFVDSVSLKHLPPFRQLRRSWKFRRPSPNYEHNTLPLDEGLKDRILQILSQQAREVKTRAGLDVQSIAIAVSHQGEGNRLLADLALIFLENGLSVQYMTASRHPIEFIDFLKKRADKKKPIFDSYSGHIFVVDAYSPHFAFMDSIYPVKTRALETLGVTCLQSRMTYAGVHSASSRAFKEIKRKLAGERIRRKPTLVIYEDFFALTDLESPEQYRIFIRHVLPSERMWDGMFTVFVESALPDSDWKLLSAYASMELDLRLPPTEPQSVKE